MTISSRVDMRAPAAASCGDLDVSISQDPESLTVNGLTIQVPVLASHSITRVGFSPSCSLAFVESFGADNLQRRLVVINLFTNAKGVSEAPDGQVVSTADLGTYLDAFLTRDDTSWVSVWQDPSDRTWSARGVALETIYDDDRETGTVTGLDRRPSDVNLHIDGAGRVTHWLLAFGTGGPIELRPT